MTGRRLIRETHRLSSTLGRCCFHSTSSVAGSSDAASNPVLLVVGAGDATGKSLRQ
jgi:hypothetical protein